MLFRLPHLLQYGHVHAFPHTDEQTGIRNMSHWTECEWLFPWEFHFLGAPIHPGIGICGKTLSWPRRLESADHPVAMSHIDMVVRHIHLHRVSFGELTISHNSPKSSFRTPASTPNPWLVE